jgi:hypothetical protein
MNAPIQIIAGISIALGLAWFFAPKQQAHIESKEQAPIPNPTPALITETTSAASSIEVESKVVVVGKQLVLVSRDAFHKAREILQSGKSDDQIDIVINRMIKDGECLQLSQFINATVIMIDGDDVQIQQRKGSAYGAKWWIERSAAQ